MIGLGIFWQVSLVLFLSVIKTNLLLIDNQKTRRLDWRRIFKKIPMKRISMRMWDVLTSGSIDVDTNESRFSSLNSIERWPWPFLCMHRNENIFHLSDRVYYSIDVNLFWFWWMLSIEYLLASSFSLSILWRDKRRKKNIVLLCIDIYSWTSSYQVDKNDDNIEYKSSRIIDLSD